MNITTQVYDKKVSQALSIAFQQPGIDSAPDRKLYLISRIKQLLKEKNAVLVSHFYVGSDLQDLADETGGCVADSLEMARFGYHHKAETVVVAGVRFMGETAKILSPQKRVLVVDSNAECSLDLGCATDDFAEFCQQYPNREVVVYANTSAEIKANADWVVTSAIALKVVEHLHKQGKKIIWGPDKYLGDYVRRKTGADMVLWQGSCIVHEEFKADALLKQKQRYPEAEILVHPESPEGVIALADMVGSTGQMINATKVSDAKTFIVATSDQIFHKMKQAAPEKKFVAAATMGESATCISCAHCPWMAMNDLEKLCKTLEDGVNEILIDENTRAKAEHSIKRMLTFKD